MDVPVNKITCLKCGECCRKLTIDEVYELDLEREPRLRPVVEPCNADIEEGRYFLPTPCIFLTADNRCRIYPTRPTVCVEFQPGDNEYCRAAARPEGAV